MNENKINYDELTEDEKTFLFYVRKLPENDKKSLLDKMDGVLMALNMIAEMLSVPAGK
ncbi:MAG: hypothetical protein IJ642_12040 [Oscillospiraceae bacterium]|nr:hypothetical protein [Oscillospiraceae bacterium]